MIDMRKYGKGQRETISKMICQECGEEVDVNEKHTFEDCLVYKDKLRLVELSRLQDKINKRSAVLTANGK